MPKPLLLGEVASSEAKMTERLYGAAPALSRLTERRPLSNLSVSHPLDSSPSRRALGKEVSFFDETDLRLPENVTECQSLSLWGRWHGEAVTERARMLAKSKKHSDTSPVCQRHRIAVLSCFILPGLPSQALTRQLPQSGSPWQKGFVFDETDWGLLENVTECQSLSL